MGLGGGEGKVGRELNQQVPQALAGKGPRRSQEQECRKGATRRRGGGQGAWQERDLAHAHLAYPRPWPPRLHHCLERGLSRAHHTSSDLPTEPSPPQTQENL